MRIPFGYFTCVVVLFVVAAGQVFAQEIQPLELSLIDDDAIGYATFQSHNQKVIENANGIFMTHLRRRNEDYTAQTWRLSRSTDGGKTFTAIYEATHATNPPVLETDAAGTVYLARPDFADGNAYLYRFSPDTEYKEPVTTVLPGGAAGKFSTFLDRPRERLYFFAHNNRFFVVGLDGVVHSSVVLLQDGPNACLQYPLLSMGGDGALHAAWTSQKHNVYLYWDIHHMLSPDGGATWRTMDGVALSPPVIADDTGPAARVTLDDEFESHTWLSSFIVKGGKAHFLYLMQGTLPRQHYVRYDLATGTREKDIQPEFKGETLQIQSLDGFFATQDASAETPLYCTGSFQGRIVCLVSKDNGDTWHDHAVSEPVGNPYSVGGCRDVTADSRIIGSFTATSGSNVTTDHTSKVYFFRIRV